MKKIEKSFVAIFTLLALNCLTLNAKAQSATDSDTDKGVYLQGGVASLKYTYGTYSYNLGTTYAVYAGYNFNKNIAAEVLTATTSTPTYSTTLNFTGFYVKPKYQLNENLEMFARVGSNTLNVTTTYGGSRSQSFSSYGGGLTAYMSADKKDYISAEYMVWATQGTEKLTGISIAYGRRF
jgi:hypothetical protein